MCYTNRWLLIAGQATFPPCPPVMKVTIKVRHHGMPRILCSKAYQVQRSFTEAAGCTLCVWPSWMVNTVKVEAAVALRTSNQISLHITATTNDSPNAITYSLIVLLLLYWLLYRTWILLMCIVRLDTRLLINEYIHKYIYIAMVHIQQRHHIHKWYFSKFMLITCKRRNLVCDNVYTNGLSTLAYATLI